MDLSDLIDRNAAFAPDKAAIRFADRTLTYAGFARRIADAARALKSQWGVAPGDRVAVLAYNHPDTLVLLYACARLGAMLVPVNWRLAVPEQLYILADASVKALVVEQALAGSCRAAASGPSRSACRRARLCARGRDHVSTRCLKAQAATAVLQAPISPRRFSSSTPPAPPAGPRARCCARTRCSPTPR